LDGGSREQIISIMAEERFIAFNVGSQQVTGAVLSKTGEGGLRLDRIERREFVGDPAEEDVRNSQCSAALKEISTALKAKGATTTYVVSSFPVLLKFASLPALDGERVDQIVEFEAQQQVPYPINEVVWGYQLMGDPDDIEVEVLLAAVKADELNETDELITGAGLKSKGAEIAPVALYNALAFNYSDLEGCTLLVDIGARTTDMIFREGNKVFIRTVKIGGADISRAIAKEFGKGFPEAEASKIRDGFVALGGPYADHEDPEIAGMSKVIRNSLTRLHSEVMRTITFYRSQQGGSAPSFVLLSGATAGLPFIREFFAEKLGLPVDHFNAFRNVKVASGCDAELVAANAHALGEIVGAALGQAGPVPASILLEPLSVKQAKDLSKRKPALVLAVVVVAMFLGALGFYFKKGAEIALSKGADIEGHASSLTRYNQEIEASKREIETIDGQKEPFVEAVRHRVYWVRLFNYLGDRLDGDTIFLTVLEPLAGGRPVIREGDSLLMDSVGGAQTEIVDALSIQGLWRENPRGSQVVTDFFARLQEDAVNEAPMAFDLVDADIGTMVNVDTGTAGDRFAYPFTMVLPLPEANQVKFINK